MMLATIADFDAELPDRWRARERERWQARQATYQREKDEKDAEWQAWYAAYRTTPEWAFRRTMVLKRAAYMCEGCGLAMASEVHHTTYAHVGNELLWELRAVCRACHERAHAEPAAS
jgi:5-methylcytosine-specific restriction endonuclease McrA